MHTFDTFMENPKIVICSTNCDLFVTQLHPGAQYPNTRTHGLVIASSNGHIQVVQVLLEVGVDVNAAVTVSFSDLNEKLARFLYIEKEENEVIAALQAVLQHITGLRAPLSFVEVGCVDDFDAVVRVLLDHSADVNLMGGRSRLPLHIAGVYGSQRLVRWMIDAGANVNAVVDGKTALIDAAGGEELSFDIVQTLLDSGAQAPSDTDSLRRIFKATLKYFYITEDRRPSSWRDDHSEGRFVYTDSLSDIFTKRPGAVLRFLLETTCWKEPYPHFSVILQMICILGDGGYVDLLPERDVDVNISNIFSRPAQIQILSGSTFHRPYE
ncbi:ankyrin repeat-containing domain protein [Xylaria acuta]|nr:ankyrin repeat-containing domain protein [Xylaria acuta]